MMRWLLALLLPCIASAQLVVVASPQARGGGEADEPPPDPPEASSWLGVPDPWFDLATEVPDRPAMWTSEIPGYYFINNETGTNSGRTYGTPTAPRDTVPNPIPAGSYVEVEGAYTSTSGGVIVLDAEGTGDSWVAATSGPAWLVGIEGDRPSFEGATVRITGSYLYMDTLLAQARGRFQIGSSTNGFPADHIVIRNSEVIGQTIDTVGSLLSATGDAPGSGVDSVVFYNNLSHDAGDLEAVTDDDIQSYGIGNYVTNVWVLGNTGYNTAGSGLQVNASDADSTITHHIYGAGNEFYNIRQAGLWVKYGQDVVFSENYVHDILPGPTSPAKGLGGQYAPHRLWIVNNLIHDVEYCVRIASTDTGVDSDIYVIGNVCHDVRDDAGEMEQPDSWYSSCIHMVGGENRYIVNNTCYGASGGIHLTDGSGTYLVANNILGDITHADGNQVWVENTGANPTFENNLLYEPSGTERIKWSSGGTLYTLAQWQSATSNCDDCIADDPDFTNAGADDYSLQASSPTLNVGSSTSVFATFVGLYGLDLDMDIAGNPRIAGGTIDIGAYERQ